MAPITVHVKCANAKKYTVTVESDLKVPDLKVRGRGGRRERDVCKCVRARAQFGFS